MAERAGFEPAVRCYPYDGLANRSFRPLRHLSANFNLRVYYNLPCGKIKHKSKKIFTSPPQTNFSLPGFALLDEENASPDSEINLKQQIPRNKSAEQKNQIQHDQKTVARFPIEVP